MHLVLITTSGNQDYIFATNKLRENVGASENTYRVGTQLVLRAVADAGGPRLWKTDPADIRKNLVDRACNPPIEAPGVEVEVVIATSGKALLLVRQVEIARDIIRRVSAEVLRTTPGVEVCGAISAPFEWGRAHLSDVNRELHQQHDEVRNKLPGAGLRFLRLPIVAECARSGLPAAAWEWRGPEAEQGPRSAVSQSKGSLAEGARERMAKLLRGQPGLRFARDLDELEHDFEEAEWLAVVHADGNGVGKIFLDFHDFAHPLDDRDYVAQLRGFSQALELCTERAFNDALAEVPTQGTRYGRRALLLPLVLGGDDLTILCDGQTALRFTARYLRAFERETGRVDDPQTRIVPRIAQEAYGIPHLSSCAGVAIIKPHFPFFAAYRLCAQLISSAKQVKRWMPKAPCSALDFHILYDSLGSELSEIRARLTLRTASGATQLFARPYVITPIKEISNPAAKVWCQQRQWEDVLLLQVGALQRRDQDGALLLPRTQVHDLREALFLGHREADARLNLLYGRYQEGLQALTGGLRSLFREAVNREGDPIRYTSLLDAIDAAGFIQPQVAP